MNNYPSTEHWRYLHGKPTSTGIIKANNVDFFVNEILPFSLCGEGEHLYVQIEKDNLNTGFVAQALAKHAHLKERDIGYAGRKDKHAITRQWFSLWLPGIKTDTLHRFELPGCRIISTQRHDKKLRTGNLLENEFEIVVSNFIAGEEFQRRVDAINAIGVPNYFGPQRFGNLNHEGISGNLALAQYLLDGDAIKKRDKRSMAISALRSWLYNEFISQRIAEHGLDFVPGDVLSLSGSNSFFTAAQLDNETAKRLEERDVQLSAPLWGRGTLASSHNALMMEQRIADQYVRICHTLEQLGLKQERRKLLLFPKNLRVSIKDKQLTLNFSLPPGCFATSVIRELVTLISPP